MGVASRVRLILADLKRRKVTRVAWVYAIVGIAVLEASQLIFEALAFPLAAWQFVSILVLLGFPIALVLAWALDITPEGIRRADSGVPVHLRQAIHAMMDPTELTDSELIEGIRSCDSRVAQYLLDQYWAPLLRYAEGILEGTADAQDIVQDAFLRLWANRDKWSEAGSVRSLLYTVTRNLALDERRRHARRGQVSDDVDIPHIGPSPSDDVVLAEARQAANDAVSRLPPKRQEVFRLAREEGLSHKEIAAIMGISVNTAANHMVHAMADLKAALAPYLDSMGDEGTGSE
jgi:RNA polymerase sigma-70 factor (ECF subfamily)